MIRFYKTARGRAGNALFIILIAIGLFAALNYAISRTSRGGTSDITEGQARVIASEILSFHAEVKNAVNLLLNGCSENELDTFTGGIWHRVVPDQYHELPNPNKRANDHCTLFHPKGGGITPRIFTKGVVDISERTASSQHPGHSRVQVRMEPGFGTELSDLTFITDGVSDQVCAAVNKLLGNPPQVTITATRASTAVIFAGNFPTYTESPWDYDHPFAPRSVCVTLKGGAWTTSPDTNNNHVMTIIYPR